MSMTGFGVARLLEVHNRFDGDSVLGVIGASRPEFQANVANQVWRLDHGLQVCNRHSLVV